MPSDPLRQPASRARAAAAHGPAHFALQVALFVALGGLYALSGVVGRHEAASATANAVSLLHLERLLHVDVELSLQRAVLRGPAILRDLADQTYFSCQFLISNAFLIWLYVRRASHYALVRDALVAANLVALVTLLVLPLAPPRLLPGGVYIDTLDAHAVSLHSGIVDALNNPYAAMPSLHASYAVVLGVAGVTLTRRWWVRAAWAAYPALVLYSIVATANHFVLDAIVGVAASATTPTIASRTKWFAVATIE